MPDLLLLDVKRLEMQFKTSEGVVHAVNGVSFSLKERDTLGVVGESGCGKNVTMLSVLGLIPCTSRKNYCGESVILMETAAADPRKPNFAFWLERRLIKNNISCTAGNIDKV